MVAPTSASPISHLKHRSKIERNIYPHHPVGWIPFSDPEKNIRRGLDTKKSGVFPTRRESFDAAS
jgi:hypothetical protein